MTISTLFQTTDAPGRSAPSRDDGLERVVRLAARALRAPAAYLSLVKGTSQSVRHAVGVSEAFVGEGALPLDELLTAEAIGSEGALSLGDLRADGREPGARLAAEGAAALLSLPLRRGSGEVVAVLGVMDRTARAWEPTDVAILADLGATALTAIRPAGPGDGMALPGGEGLYRSLVENAADVTAIVSAGGTIDFATPSVGRALGYPPAELVGQNAFALLHPGDAPVVIGQFARLTRGESCQGTIDCRVRHRDGSWRTLQVGVNNLLHDPAVAGVVVSARDITDARIAKETERRLQAFLEATPDFVATFDPHGRALSVNAAFRRVAGLAPDAPLASLTLTDLFPPAVTELILHEGIPEASRSGTWSGETALEDTDGIEIPISQVIIAHKSADGSLEFLSTLARDITERKRAEHEVVAQRAFYEQILENIDVDIAVFDAEGRYEYVNQNAVRDAEVRRAMIGKTDAEYVALRGRSPEIGRRRQEQMRAVVESGRGAEFEEQLTTAAGEVRYFIRKHLPITDGDRVARLIGYGFDITARRTAEEERRRSVELLNEAERIAHMGSWEWDIPTGELRWSRELYLVYGLDPDAEPVTPERYFSLLHPDDRPVSQAITERALADHQPYTFDHRVVRPDGVVRNIHGRGRVVLDAAGAPLRMVGSGQDVTDRVAAEEALRQSERDYRSIFENAHDGIVIMIPEGEVVLEVNPRACEMYGYSREEFIGMSMEAVSTNIAAGRARVNQTVELDSSWSFEVVQRRKDGSTIWAEITAAVVDHKGQLAILSIIRDISERHAAEAALRESQEQLLQSQKMEAVGRLAGGIAHDFNNLLTAIKGFTELLLLDFDQHDPRHSFVTEIQGAANRAAALTRQLLAFSRKQVLQPCVLDLNASVTDIDKMLRRLLGEDIELETVAGAGLARVKADPSQIEQVLVNLAVNSRDAMPGGGRIVIRTSNVEIAAHQIPADSEARPGAYVQLAVTDNGTGMTPEVQARIFEPFFTTKGKGKGTGLGLSTVYGIVQQSGGIMEVESAPGEGTTFRVCFPAVRDAVDGAGESAARDRGPVTGHETVLLVEDEAAVRVLVRRVLDRNGYRVLEAESGVHAAQLLAGKAEPIDLLLTDVVMPGMSGPELASRLAGLHPGIRILYMSGYTDEAIVHHGVLDPGIALLEKPFTPEVLLRKLREILDSPAGPAR